MINLSIYFRFLTFSNFISGQCLEAIILGMMFVICMSIFGMPYAVLVGVLIAFTALIPIVGAFIGCAVGAFLILMVSPVKALVFIIMFLVLQETILFFHQLCTFLSQKLIFQPLPFLLFPQTACIINESVNVFDSHATDIERRAEGCVRVFMNMTA